MTFTTVATYTANIYVGLRAGYAGQISPAERASTLIQEYVNKVGLCVTMTPTTFIYTDGSEPGLIIGLINYPRFPSDKSTIWQHAVEIATMLREELQQTRVSIVFPDETIMLGDA